MPVVVCAQVTTCLVFSRGPTLSLLSIGSKRTLEKVLHGQEEPEVSVWTELKSEADDVTAFKRNVVQAHQELARLAGPAGEPFRVLADDLARELAAEQPPDSHDNIH